MRRYLPKPDGPTFRRRAFPLAVFALMAGMFCLAPVSAEDKAGARATGLSMLEVWKGQAFRTGRADFGAGVDKGLESFGKALLGAITPRLEERLELVPAFRSGVGSYSVTIGYVETGITILASATRSGATIDMTGHGPDGAALRSGASVDGIDVRLGEGRLRADVLRSFRNVPVGKSRIGVAVAGADGRAPGVVEISVVRLDADLTNAEEREIYFRAAAVEGKAEALARAIEAGAEVDAKLSLDQGKATALIVAAVKGFEDAARVAVRAGADVNAALHVPGGRAHGASALLLAVGGGHEGIVKLLLDGGADPDLALPGPEVHRTLAVAGGTPLVIALDRGRDRIVRLLIEAGADVNRPLPDAVAGSVATSSGASPLMLATFLGKADLVDALIAAGADVNYRIPGERRRGGRNPRTAGLTALQVATGEGHTAIAERLRKTGASR